MSKNKTLRNAKDLLRQICWMHTKHGCWASIAKLGEMICRKDRATVTQRRDYLESLGLIKRGGKTSRGKINHIPSKEAMDWYQNDGSFQGFMRLCSNALIPPEPEKPYTCNSENPTPIYTLSYPIENTSYSMGLRPDKGQILTQLEVFLRNGGYCEAHIARTIDAILNGKRKITNLWSYALSIIEGLTRNAKIGFLMRNRGFSNPYHQKMEKTQWKPKQGYS